MDKIKTHFDKPIRYNKSHWSSGDALFFVTGRKRPVAYGTVSEMNSLLLLDKALGGLNQIAESYNNGLIILSQGEKDIVEVKLSYGEERME